MKKGDSEYKLIELLIGKFDTLYDNGKVVWSEKEDGE